MRADHVTYYDASGRIYLVVCSPDAPFVVSAYVEHGSRSAWYFGYTRKEQAAIAAVIGGAPELRRAMVFAWYDAVNPHVEGQQPGAYLDLLVNGDTGWARYPTGVREDGHPVVLLTVDENSAMPGAVRLGRRTIFADRPFLPVGRIRAAGVEYVHTGQLPKSVAWQGRASLVPREKFGRQAVAEHDLPPRLEWRYPERAQPWAHDPPPLHVS